MKLYIVGCEKSQQEAALNILRDEVLKKPGQRIGLVAVKVDEELDFPFWLMVVCRNNRMGVVIPTGFAEVRDVTVPEGLIVYSSEYGKPYPDLGVLTHAMRVDHGLKVKELALIR